jgi:hypothetical protein
VFGGIACAAGFIGVALGAELSRRYRSRYGHSDALVCAFGLLGSIPFLFLTLIWASKYIYLSYVSIRESVQPKQMFNSNQGPCSNY